MDSNSQKRKIRRFINGAIKDGIDSFCIYQWIERCHYQEWWELGIALGSHLQPNSMNKDYQKRLDFILSECRLNYDRDKTSQSPTMRKIMESLSSLSSEEKDAAFEILKKIDFINVDKKIKKNDRKVSGVDFTGKTVRGFKLSGQNYTAHSYRDVYLNIIQMVFKQNPQKKDRILSLQGRDRKYFSCNPIELTKDRVRIPDSDIYAELNENANTLYRRSKKILQLYGMDHESLEILTY